ncbi:MAG TPA: MarR family transcriptional regulator, partial [Nocardioides sp.]|nr:MarR family transcriptional regulator [Nocardioides sp.]
MATSVHPRLDNLLASLTLNLADEGRVALEEAAGLSGSAALALLALEEFLGDAHVGRLAEVMGVTHSGAVRLVTHLEREGLAERRSGADRRRVEVRLT